MATLDWHVTSQGGVTLVSLLVTSEASERVRVTNCLDGPVWPPRRQGLPEEGWDEDGYEGRVAADERLVLGYACPADPAEPPARVTSLGASDTGGTVTAREVVRTLGDPSPPRDAVSDGGTGTFDSRDTSAPETRGTSGLDGHGAGDPDGTGARVPDDGATGDGNGSLDDWEWPGANGGFDADGADERDSDGQPACGDTVEEERGAVEAWLADAESRVERAERLAGVSSVSEASAAVSELGGPDDVTRLPARLDEDRERLREVADRCESLASRLEDVSVPVETLTRLA